MTVQRRSWSSQTGELTAVDYTDATPDIRSRYDRLGRQTMVADGTGTHAFEYDHVTLALNSEKIEGIADATLTTNIVRVVSRAVCRV